MHERDEGRWRIAVERADELRERLRRQPVGSVDQARRIADELGNRAEGVIERAAMAVGHVGDFEARRAIGGDRRAQLVQLPARHDERSTVNPGGLQLLEHMADDRAVGDTLERSAS